MSQVIVFPRGQLNSKDKERMTKMGICAIEADHPHQVVMLCPGSSMVTGDDLLMAALAGVNTDYGGNRHQMMTEELQRRLKAREEKGTTP